MDKQISKIKIVKSVLLALLLLVVATIVINKTQPAHTISMFVGIIIGFILIEVFQIQK